MHLKKAGILFVLFVFFTMPVYASSGSLEGTVTDSVTGYGIYGAIVRVGLGGGSYVTTSTAASGFYEFSDSLPAGTGYTMTVIKSGYDNHNGIAPDIVAGDIKYYNAIMSAKSGTGTLDITVVDDAGNPIPGAYLIVNYISIIADENGFASIRLSPGAYDIEALRFCFEDYLDSDVVVSADSTTVHTVVMTPIPDCCTVPVDDLVITEDTTLCEGTYNVNTLDGDEAVIKIETDGVTLTCANTKLIGPGTWLSTNEAGIVVKNSNGVEVKHCDLRDFKSGIRVVDSQNAVIRNNTVHHNAIGILVMGAQSSTIINNTAHNNADGIRSEGVGSNSDVTFTDNIVYSNTGSNPLGNGMWIIADSSEVSDNHIFSNLRSGIHVIGDNNLIDNNYIHDNSGVASFNLKLTGSGATVTNNIIKGGPGVQLENLGTSTFTNNFLNRTDAGFLISGDNNVFDGNIINKSFYGFEIGIGSQNNEFYNNEVYRSWGDGFFINSGTLTTNIHDNWACCNLGQDIFRDVSAPAEIGDDNTCDSAQNWNDQGDIGCANACGIVCPTCISPETECSDNVDNDCDGDIDGADSDCQPPILPTTCFDYDGDTYNQPLIDWMINDLPVPYYSNEVNTDLGPDGNIYMIYNYGSGGTVRSSYTIFNRNGDIIKAPEDLGEDLGSGNVDFPGIIKVDSKGKYHILVNGEYKTDSGIPATTIPVALSSKYELALDSNDNPHIVYASTTLKHKWWEGSSWQEYDSGISSDFVEKVLIGSDEKIHVFLYPNIHYIITNNNQFSSSYTMPIGPSGSSDADNIALDSSNHPHVVGYTGSDHVLRYSYFDGSSWTVPETLTDPEVSSYEPSLFIDAEDNIHFTYHVIESLDPYMTKCYHAIKSGTSGLIGGGEEKGACSLNLLLGDTSGIFVIYNILNPDYSYSHRIAFRPSPDLDCGLPDCDDDTSDDPPGCPASSAGCTESTRGCAVCINPGMPSSYNLPGDGIASDCNQCEIPTLIKLSDNSLDPLIKWADDSYAVLYSKILAPYHNNPVLAKVSESGDILWSSDIVSADNIDVKSFDWDPMNNHYIISYSKQVGLNDPPADIKTRIIGSSGTVLSEKTVGTIGYTDKHSVVWNHHLASDYEYAMASTLNHALYFSKLDSNGELVETLPISTSNENLISSFFWDSRLNSYILIYLYKAYGRDDLMAAVIQPDGTFTEKRLMENVLDTKFAGWAGFYGAIVVKEDASYTRIPYLVKFDGDLNVIGSEISVPHYDGVFELVGNTYLIPYTQDGQVYLMRYDLDGNLIDESIATQDLNRLYSYYASTNAVDYKPTSISNNGDSIVLGVYDSFAGPASFLSFLYCSIVPPTCSDGIQNQDETGVDCGGAVCPACAAPACEFTDAYWSTDETTAGTKVKLTAESTPECNGKDVEFIIIEDDLLLNDDQVNDEFMMRPQGKITNGKVEAEWYAAYIPDCLIAGFAACDPPEFFFRAEIVENRDINIESDDMKVFKNQIPSQPDPFLIEPNGGEEYGLQYAKRYAHVQWNPAVDPEEDSVVYSLYYSDDSGNTWSAPIVSDYGYVNKINGEEEFTVSLG